MSAEEPSQDPTVRALISEEQARALYDTPSGRQAAETALHALGIDDPSESDIIEVAGENGQFERYISGNPNDLGTRVRPLRVEELGLPQAGGAFMKAHGPEASANDIGKRQKIKVVRDAQE